MGSFEVHRRKRLAKAIIVKLTEIGRNENCKSIFLLKAHDNFPAQALYESGAEEKHTGEILYVYELGDVE